MAADPRTGLGTLRGGVERVAALGRGRRIAAAASAVWVVLVGAYAIGFFATSQARGTTFIDGAFFLVTLALPLVLVWLAAFVAEELERQREMIAALGELVGPLIGALGAAQGSLDRHAPASPAEIARAVQGAVASGKGTEGAGAALERVLAGQAQIAAGVEALLELASAARTAPALSASASVVSPHTATPPPAKRAKPRPESPPEPAGQPDLPLLAAPAPEAALDWGDLVRALDFPRDEDDAEGFRALRSALRVHSLAKMLQAAEDVLTLLSQEGVYMDDLAVEPPDSQGWRRFIAGERGAAVAGVGGVRDAAALTSARALMKADPIFRDTALFFQRRFDAVLGDLAATAGDDELAQLADTRSGRAFQLMARASGSFD